MNPVVLIATHNRVNVTCRNIELLQMQSLKPKIVLVCSSIVEFEIYTNRFEDVTVVLHSNFPLGAKWQYGAFIAKNFNPDPLIIIGSDDYFGKNYIENFCGKMKELQWEFMGTNEWWIYDEPTGEIFQMEYAKKDFPLGGGRGYSEKLLQRMKYTVFDSTKNKHLDDYGWFAFQKTGQKGGILKGAISEGINIVSIKGNWETMNSTERILKSKSCTLVNKFTNGNQKLEDLL